jgi:tRNA 2-selenouridine synthase
MGTHPGAQGPATIEEIDRFDAIVDVRSPAEFEEDHVPGAINLPVLDNEQRAQVGTIYVQESPFAARRLGAALVARNIARHIEDTLLDYPKAWRPLVYCWRGGQRSGAMTSVLHQIGWPARQLAGGYKTYRRAVLSDLETLPGRFQYLVLHGPTGSGKTALIEALREEGGQVLDLEAMARHRGSVLGGSFDGDYAQPGQKAFESALWARLRHLDPKRPVFVESESQRIGRLALPRALFDAMKDAACLRVAVPIEQRVTHLLDRYKDIYGRPEALRARLDFFVPLHGKKTVEQWRAWIDAAQWRELAIDLVRTHYDPAYRRNGQGYYRKVQQAPTLEMASLDRDAIILAARDLLRGSVTGNAE